MAREPSIERMTDVNGYTFQYTTNPSISPDGKTLAYVLNSDLTYSRFRTIYIRNLNTGEETEISNNVGKVTAPVISADRRFVAYRSLEQQELNSFGTIRIRELSTGTDQLVSATADGEALTFNSFQPSINADGRYVAFASGNIFLKDMVTGNLTVISKNNAGVEGNSISSSPSMSADGRYITFSSLATNLVPNDTNGRADAFVKDVVNGTLMRIGNGGNEANADVRNPKITGGGRFVFFQSQATNLVTPEVQSGYEHFYRQDLQTGDVRLVASTVNNEILNTSRNPFDVSADGRYLVYLAVTTDAGSDIVNVFLKDMTTDEVVQITQLPEGIRADDHSYDPSISADGRLITFISLAKNLTLSDVNGRTDVFKATNPIWQ